jgi:putative transposase
MSRFRLLPTDGQEEALLGHCRDARYVWNLAVEQQRHWQPGRKAPGYLQQCAQLTEARVEYAWLRAGSQTVQQQALRVSHRPCETSSAALAVARRGAKLVCMKGFGRSR